MFYILWALCLLYLAVPAVMIRWEKSRIKKFMFTLMSLMGLSIAAAFVIEPSNNILGNYIIAAPVLMFLASPLVTIYVLTKRVPTLYKLKKKVALFLKEWSPVLEQEIDDIRSEVLRLEDMIKKTKKLRKEFPQRRDILTPKIIQIENVQHELQNSLRAIKSQVENAYILSEFGQIQEQKNINTIREEVQESAHTALGLADCINDAFEDDFSLDQ